MAEPLKFVRLVGDYWGTLGFRTAIRARDALENAENETYTFEKMALDVLGFYNDSIGIAISLIGAQGKPLQLPALNIPVPLNTNTATGTFALGLAAGTVLERSDLFSLANPPAVRVLKTSVTVTLLAGGAVKIDLAGLNGVVAKGFYEGLLFGNGLPAGRIQLQVT